MQQVRYAGSGNWLIGSGEFHRTLCHMEYVAGRIASPHQPRFHFV